MRSLALRLVKVLEITMRWMDGVEFWGYGFINGLPRR